MGQKLVPSLVILGLADLVLSANLRHRLAFKPLKDNHGFGVGIPFPSLHG
jgi:hypothetical protein